MSLAVLTPLVLSLAVPDTATLSPPVEAADLCVSVITTGKTDTAPLQTAGWAENAEVGTKTLQVWYNPAKTAAIALDRPEVGGRPKCTVLVPGSERGQNVIEFHLAAHFNGRVFPIGTNTTGYEVPGHKVAIFSTRKTIKDRPVLEIIVTNFEPKGGTK